MATTTSRPVSIRFKNNLLSDCEKYKINKSKVCNEAIRKAIAEEKQRRKGK